MYLTLMALKKIERWHAKESDWQTIYKQYFLICSLYLKKAPFNSVRLLIYFNEISHQFWISGFLMDFSL